VSVNNVLYQAQYADALIITTSPIVVHEQCHLLSVLCHFRFTKMC